MYFATKDNFSNQFLVKPTCCQNTNPTQYTNQQMLYDYLAERGLHSDLVQEIVFISFAYNLTRGNLASNLLYVSLWSSKDRDSWPVLHIYVTSCLVPLVYSYVCCRLWTVEFLSLVWIQQVTKLGHHIWLWVTVRFDRWPKLKVFY